MSPRTRCLPVIPTVRRLEVIVVDYCTGEGTPSEPAHLHTVVYDLDGQVIANACTYWPHQETTIDPADGDR